jgi:hypothetical protein
VKYITQELAQWLDEHNAQLSFTIGGPKGGSVPPETWIPAGWTILVNVVAPDDKPEEVNNASPYIALADGN